MLALFIVYLLCGVIIVILSLPLLSGKIPPNHWYGLRIPVTLNDKSIWIKANKIAGKYLFVYGISVILINTLIMLLKVSENVYSIGMALFIFFGAIIFGITLNKASTKLNKK